jgi:hypothetical protein
LGADEFVISADEKTSIQARRPKQPTLPPGPNRPTRVEYEYFRGGAWVYLAAWDVHRAKVFGRCEFENGIAPVDRLVSEVMSQDPYKSARRVFWIMDNCSPRRGIGPVLPRGISRQLCRFRRRDDGLRGRRFLAPWIDSAHGDRCRPRRVPHPIAARSGSIWF